MKHLKKWLLGSLCLVLVGVTSLGQAQQERGPAIDPKVDTIMRKMSDYLDSLKHFTIAAESSIDVLQQSGQKVQLGRAVDVFVRRPNRLRANLKGDIFDQELFYDGKTVTLYGKKVNFYASLKAPATIEEALDLAEESAGLVAPMADVIYRNSYDVLMKDVQAGFYAGLSNVNRIECHHLVFRADETDWQIWIENSESPIPRKIVITSKWITGAPQFTGVITKWDTAAKLEDSLFTFVAPKDAQKIEFLPPEN